MKANPNFWRGKSKIDGITFVSYKNSDAAVQGLKSGDIDLVDGLTPAQYESLEKSDNIKVNAGIGRRYQALAINPGAVDKDGKKLGDGNPALKDPELRKAIFMAIDKETIVKRVLDGLGTVGQTEMPGDVQGLLRLRRRTRGRAVRPRRRQQGAGRRRLREGLRRHP